jgi:hypothetical protein
MSIEISIIRPVKRAEKILDKLVYQISDTLHEIGEKFEIDYRIAVL